MIHLFWSYVFSHTPNTKEALTMSVSTDIFNYIRLTTAPYWTNASSTRLPFELFLKPYLELILTEVTTGKKSKGIPMKKCVGMFLFEKYEEISAFCYSLCAISFRFDQDSTRSIGFLFFFLSISLTQYSQSSKWSTRHPSYIIWC